MFLYKGGTVVGKGLYWNPQDGQRIDLREDGPLPGDEVRSYLKMSPVGLLLIAPLLGMMYVLFLPLFGIGVFLISCLARTILTILAVAVPGVRVCGRITGRSMLGKWKASLLHDRSASQPSPGSSVGPAAPWDTKVLLVDDEMAYVDTLAQRLALRGLKTDVVYNGEQALGFVNDEEPDVMVLDLRMPGMDGMEVLRRIRQGRLGVQVIILTSKGNEKDREEAGRLGIFDFLRKPIDIDTLMAKIKEACGRRIGSPAPGYAYVKE